jgi:simple sugar transport system permease protein
VNIGIEGTMLAAAFVGWVVAAVLAPAMGQNATAIFGMTPALLIGLLAAIAIGMVVSLLHAYLSISLRANQIISGTIVNIAAFGVTGYLYTLISPSSPASAGSFTLFRPPVELTNLPAVGWIFRTLLNQGPLTISLIVIVILMQVMLFRTRWGLRTRAVGEHPKAAETVGVDVVRLRYRNVVLAGGLAALGGAVLSMETTSSFLKEMTAGRGFIGLAAMIVGRWTPLGALGAALLFSSADAVSHSLSFVPPPGQLGDLLTSVPPEFFNALPYLVTVIVLAGLIGRSVPPAADGLPYEREAAA